MTTPDQARAIAAGLTPEQIADGWIAHDGGPCPVEPYRKPGIIIRGFERWHLCQMPGGPEADESMAFFWDWQHGPPAAQIIAYRPEPKP